MQRAKRIFSVSSLCVLLFASLLSVGEAVEPSKELQKPTLTPTIPIYNVPPVTARSVGIIERAGATSYRYGTYVLKPDIGYKQYALKSNSLNLDQYVGKKVDVSGELISGYPRDGGPDYMNVESIFEVSSQ